MLAAVRSTLTKSSALIGLHLIDRATLALLLAGAFAAMILFFCMLLVLLGLVRRWSGAENAGEAARRAIELAFGPRRSAIREPPDRARRPAGDHRREP